MTQEIYIWIMTSGIYDTLQIWGQNEDISYYKVYCNSNFIEDIKIENDDDIVYITIEELNLNPPSHLWVIGFDSNNEMICYSNACYWEDNGVYDNDYEPSYNPNLRYQQKSCSLSITLDGKQLQHPLYYGCFYLSGADSLVQTPSAAVIDPVDNSRIKCTFEEPEGYVFFCFNKPLKDFSISASAESIAIDAISQEKSRKIQKLKRVSGGDNYFTFQNAHEIPDDCLVFYSSLNNFKLSMTGNSRTLQYSTDYSTWKTFSTTSGTKYSSKNGQLFIRGSNNTAMSTSSKVNTFSLSDSAGCYGNIMTLLDYTNPSATSLSTEYCFRGLFNGNHYLTHAPSLPATTLSSHCYQSMFSGCSSLITAPEILPASIATSGCYSYMFDNCLSLVTAPKISATTFNTEACYNMYDGCRQLKKLYQIQVDTINDTTSSNYIFTGMYDDTVIFRDDDDSTATREVTFLKGSDIKTYWYVAITYSDPTRDSVYGRRDTHIKPGDTCRINDDVEFIAI